MSISDLGLGNDLRQVPLASIEKELDTLWREVNESALAAGGAPVSRNMVVTIVAFASNRVQAHEALAAIDELIVQHPSRAIVVLAEPELPESAISAYVAARHQGSGAATGYGEEIVIEAQGDAALHVPGVVLPLMVTGLPAFLWWNSEPPWGSALVETLVDGSDRLIIDSSNSPDADRTLAAAADLMRRKHTRSVLSDFNWTRQTPWRDLTAQFFDSPVLRRYLSGVDRVTVEYAAGDEDAPTNAAQAYLYMGWLASRLTWSLPLTHRRSFGPARQHTLHDDTGRPVLVELNARFGLPTATWLEIDHWTRFGWGGAGTAQQRAPYDGATRPAGAVAQPMIGHGALMSVRIHAVADHRPGTFIIARDQDLQHATTLCHVDTGAQPSRTVHLASLGETALLRSQLELQGHDPIYEDALTTAARLVGYEQRRSGL